METSEIEWKGGGTKTLSEEFLAGRIDGGRGLERGGYTNWWNLSY